MNFVNLTPHDVKLCDENGNVIKAFPKFGFVARVNEIVEPCFEIKDYNGISIPFIQKTYSTIENLPETKENTYYIVSVLVLNALKNQTRFDCICPDTGPDSAVRDSTGNIVGIKRFQINNILKVFLSKSQLIQLTKSKGILRNEKDQSRKPKSSIWSNCETNGKQNFVKQEKCFSFLFEQGRKIDKS